MAEFQFRIEDLRLWAPQEAEVLQWPDRIPIYDHNAKTDHRAFLTGHTYIFTLPHNLEEVLRRGEGEILPHFEGMSEDIIGNSTPRQRLTHLIFHNFRQGSEVF